MNPLTHKAIRIFVLVGIGVLIVAKVVVPWFIEQAYEGRSLDFLNALIRGQASHPVAFYLNAWAEAVGPFMWAYLIWGLLAVVAFDVMHWPTFLERFVGDVRPSALGAVRMLICGLLFLNLWPEDIPSSVLVPQQLRESSGVLQLFYFLPFFTEFVESEGALRIAQWLTLGLLLCGAIGWKTRIALPLAAIGWLILGGVIRQSIWVFHQGMAPWYVLVALVFLPCGDGLSIDRLIKVAKGEGAGSPPSTSLYGLGRFACWSIVALVYTDAGLSKLLHGGPLWWSPPQIQSILYEDTLNLTDYGWAFSLMLPQWDILFSALGLAAFLGELFYGLAVFFRWARLVFPPLMLLMHVGIFFFQTILFLDLMLIQLIFVDWSWVRRVLTKRISGSRESIEILYDGQCPLCRRTVRVLTAFDLFQQLRYIDFRQIDLPAYNQQHNLNLTISELDREMYVLDRGRSYVGFYGYRLIGLRLPIFWPIVPWLFLPGISHAGIAIYQYIARERLKLVRCDDTCMVPPNVQKGLGDRKDIAIYATQPVVITVIAGIMLLGSLVYGIEYFPISAFGMYSDRRDSGSVTYYKVWARDASNSLKEARMDEMIPALTHNRFRFRLGWCFDVMTLGKCEQLVAAVAQYYNKHQIPSRQVQGYDIEEWVWNFRDTPDDPLHGQVRRHTAIDLHNKTVRILPSLYGVNATPSQISVTVSEMPVGAITLGTGWNTWDHWWQEFIPRFRLTWTEDQWTSYLNLLKESGADWVRLDYNYANTEPRNDNSDPTVIDWKAFTFDSPGLKSLYKMLDFCQAHGINVYLTHTYLRSNHVYNLDKGTGWLSKEAVSKGYPPLWTRPTDEPVDRRELAENLAATTYFLIKERKYTVIKQVALYVEPDTQWINVDGFRDTVFLGELLTKLGIRDQVAILAPHVAPHTGSNYALSQIPKHIAANVLGRHDMKEQKNGLPSFSDGEVLVPEADYDVYAIEDYSAGVDWIHPEQGLGNLNAGFKTVVKEVKKLNPSIEVALMEYGKMWNEGATDPLPSYRSTLSAACLVFELYNSGFAGTQRWAFSPLYHHFQGFGVITVEGVSFAFPATEVTQESVTPVIAAMLQGAKIIKVPHTFEPQRLVNTNLQRGAKVYQTTVIDPTAPGKGVCAIAAETPEGKLRVGLINLYPSVVDVSLTFKKHVGSGQFHWDYYDDSLPLQIIHKEFAGSPNDDRANVQLSPHSLNFLIE